MGLVEDQQALLGPAADVERQRIAVFLPAQHLDGLAEADVVGDEEVGPRQLEGPFERYQLMVEQIDPSPERSLEKPGVGRGHTMPAQGGEVGGKGRGRVERSWFGQGLGMAVADLRAQLGFPKHFERPALAVVVKTHEAHPVR